MTRISKLWSKFFQEINRNVIKSTINKQILFHLNIGFLGRKPKQYIQKVVTCKWSSWVLLFRNNCMNTHKIYIQKQIFIFLCKHYITLILNSKSWYIRATVAQVLYTKALMWMKRKRENQKMKLERKKKDGMA